MIDATDDHGEHLRALWESAERASAAAAERRKLATWNGLDDRNELRAHLVDDGTSSRKAAAAMARDDAAMTSERLAEIVAQYALPGQVGRRMTIFDLARIEELLAEVERLRDQVDRQATSFVEQRGKLYEAMNNLAEAQEKARFYAERVDAYMVENIQRKAREAALLETLAAIVMPYESADVSPLLLVGVPPRFVEKARALLASTEAEPGEPQEQAAQGEE